MIKKLTPDLKVKKAVSKAKTVKPKHPKPSFEPVQNSKPVKPTHFVPLSPSNSNISTEQGVLTVATKHEYLYLNKTCYRALRGAPWIEFLYDKHYKLLKVVPSTAKNQNSVYVSKRNKMYSNIRNKGIYWSVARLVSLKKAQKTAHFEAKQTNKNSIVFQF